MCERILAQNCQKFDNFNLEFSMSHHNARYQSYKNAPYDVVQPVASLIECGRELWGTFIVLGGAPSTLSWGGSPTSSYSSDPPQPLLFAAFVWHSISLACLRIACFLVTLQPNRRKGRQKENDSELLQ